MDFLTVFQTLMNWGVPALAGGIALLLAFACAYLLYRKVFHGKRTVTKRQAVCGCLLACWFILVFCLTSLSRGANYSGSFNMDFLSGYISAWNHWSVTELQLILFNMLMFAPLGFLLPLLWKEAERLRVTLTVSLSLTALLEVFQLLTGTGIFELDDLFHNLIGSLFGYFCIMAILKTVRDKRVRAVPLAKALLIPCVVGLTLAVVFYAYNHQPYGNMSILPAAKQDMSSVRIETDWRPSARASTAAVYKNRFAEDKGYMEKITSALGKLEGLHFLQKNRWDNENRVYTGTDADGKDFQMNFFYRTGEWNYTTFSEKSAQLSEEEAQTLRHYYEAWMEEQGLLPAGIVFSVQNGDTLRWDVVKEQDINTGSEAFQQGSVMIQFDGSGALANFIYQICWNEFAATEGIISESGAYAQVEQGNFEQYVPFQQGDVLHVEACSLTYLYDTKGFYQPVYEFSGYLNDEENLWICRIPALSGR